MKNRKVLIFLITVGSPFVIFYLKNSDEKGSQKLWTAFKFATLVGLGSLTPQNANAEKFFNHSNNAPIVNAPIRGKSRNLSPKLYSLDQD
jgi:hypothetical protein